MFGVVIFAEVFTIVTSGIRASLCNIEDINPCKLCTTGNELFNLLKNTQYNLLIVTLKDVNNSEKQYEFIASVKLSFPHVRIIAIAPKISKDVVFRSVKCGANGFLSADATIQELKEAVYTVRGGHEYFSSSITNLLVNNYVETMRKESNGQVQDAAKLGKREIEVLSLWGEGYTNVEIADRLFISVRTVESHKNHIMQKLGIRTTVDLLKFAIRNNIVSI